MRNGIVHFQTALSPEVEARNIEEELQKVLNSRTFSNSPRLRQLLNHVVTNWLAGSVNQLDGYNLALAVFNRLETFEPALDPIVRVEMSRLRNKLGAYYRSEGALDSFRIDIPKGSYIPVLSDERHRAEAPRQENAAGVTVMVLPFLSVGITSDSVACNATGIWDQLIS